MQSQGVRVLSCFKSAPLQSFPCSSIHLSSSTFLWVAVYIFALHTLADRLLRAHLQQSLKSSVRMEKKRAATENKVSTVDQDTHGGKRRCIAGNQQVEDYQNVIRSAALHDCNYLLHGCINGMSTLLTAAACACVCCLHCSLVESRNWHFAQGSKARCCRYGRI